MASRARRDGDRLLAALVQLAIVVPALAVGWVRDDGRIAAVLYREPKLVAAGVLGWTFAAAFLWAWRRRLTAADLAAAIERPAMLALGAFLAYLAATGLWVRVPQNYFYELDQYLLLALLVVLLLAWTERDARLPGRVRAGLVASLAAVTAVGVLQILAPLPFLSPIDPEIGVAHPSLMGYKNPAALAVLGQLFLLAGWVAETRGNAGRGVSRRLGLGLLLAVELVYLVSLRSRTSYAALAAGSVFLVGLWLARRPPRRALLRGAAAAAAAIALVAAAVAIHAPARERARSALAYAASPRAYLESDRGVYLRNTLNMARHRPLGVGLGDWQTQYPVFRSVRRTADFMDPPPDVDVRRAHSDHVQLLGEAGWPGLVLWLGFLLLLAAAPIRRALRRCPGRRPRRGHGERLLPGDAVPQAPILPRRLPGAGGASAPPERARAVRPYTDEGNAGGGRRPGARGAASARLPRPPGAQGGPRRGGRDELPSRGRRRRPRRRPRARRRPRPHQDALSRLPPGRAQRPASRRRRPGRSRRPQVPRAPPLPPQRAAIHGDGGRRSRDSGALAARVRAREGRGRPRLRSSIPAIGSLTPIAVDSGRSVV
jgi:hypothetical protein